jgi:hypothetical protein
MARIMYLHFDGQSELKERLAELEEAEPGCTTLGSAAFLGRNFRATDQSQKVAVVGRL